MQHASLPPARNMRRFGSVVTRIGDAPIMPSLIEVVISASTTLWPSVDSMLGQRRRRWPNIKPTLSQRVVSPSIARFTTWLCAHIDHLYFTMFCFNSAVLDYFTKFCILWHLHMLHQISLLKVMQSSVSKELAYYHDNLHGCICIREYICIMLLLLTSHRDITLNISFDLSQFVCSANIKNMHTLYIHPWWLLLETN